MNGEPSPQLLDFLQQAIACCRTNAAFPHVPPFARRRLREAGDNVAFFLQQNEHRRAFREARIAMSVNSAVARYVETSANAVADLREAIEDSLSGLD